MVGAKKWGLLSLRWMKMLSTKSFLTLLTTKIYLEYYSGIAKT